MKVYDLFSKRQQRARGEYPDVYTYDDIPVSLRKQIVQILWDAIGTYVENRHGDTRVQGSYAFICQALCREYGQFRLLDSNLRPHKELIGFILTCDELEKLLDVIEFSFHYIDAVIRDDYLYKEYTSLSPDVAIEELNYRFNEHGVGYQYESGQLIRADSKVLHSEVAKPALRLLAEKKLRRSKQGVSTGTRALPKTQVSRVFERVFESL